MGGEKCSFQRIKKSPPGITPAWAGKRIWRLFHEYLFRDHPRMGGEKLKHPKYTTDEGGSPPHGRGKGNV